MNEELRRRLVLDLQKSGYSSEMRAVDACITAKWECHGSAAYFDKDERRTRECDFEATREWNVSHSDRNSMQVVARLLGQVKKSEQPWIVFMDRNIRPSRFTDGWDNIIATSEAKDDKIVQVLQKYALRIRNGWIGTGIHEAFKKPTDTSRWYSAFVSACKAAESAFDNAVNAKRPGQHFEMIKPLIVVDSMMVGAELSEGNTALTQIEAAAFTFEYRSDTYTRPHYCLDVVTLEAFPRYLELFSKRMNRVVDAFRVMRNGK